MKTNVQITSLISYFGEVVHTLGKRQKKVLWAFTQKENFTNTEVASFLTLPINTVTPRVYELRAKRLLREHCIRVCKVTGQKAKAWEIVPSDKEEKSEENSLVSLGI